MKKFLSLILLIPTFAFGFHVAVNCASTSVPTTYQITTPSLQPNLTAMNKYTNHLQVNNPSSTRICVQTLATSVATAPSTPSIGEHCTPANALFAWDFVAINGNIFIRADGASCVSSTIDVDAW